MNVRDVAIAAVLATLLANLLIAVTPAGGIFYVGSILVGSVAGLLVARHLVVPYLDGDWNQR
ncbi:hypothetical protein [Halosegnis longus]|uniref:Uncharacterized protein n=1 Tax=Halosegnis longus TaxID=2216012 RepID=A0AAJ4UWD0_9EURY|nr:MULTISPECIES: hypothetical protein [Halobacteriales]RNJ26962.1 hypothetical protein Nmn1133_09880 [Salella cibi]